MGEGEQRRFEGLVGRGEAVPAQPVEEYLEDLDRLIAAHDPMAQDRVVAAIGAGRASREAVQRLALECYHLGKWTTPELALLIANAPDAYSFTMEHSLHYRHWAQSFAAEVGYLRDPNHVGMQVDVCRQLGLSDDEIGAYRPLPETVATAFTVLYYVRRSYEEGLAVLGYAGERVAAGAAYARTLSEGLARHYGVRAGSFAGAEPDRRAGAAAVFRAVAVTRTVQDRCREAVRNSLLVAGARVRAMNAWVE